MLFSSSSVKPEGGVSEVQNNKKKKDEQRLYNRLRLRR